MRRWLKWTLLAFALAVGVFVVLAGVGGYYFLRHLETADATEADALKRIASVRAMFPERAPLVEIINPQSGDIRINKLTHPERKEATILHVFTWKAADGERLETDVPLWLMRFSSVNVLSRLGLAPSRYRLVVSDIERYGPGIVADYRRPGHSHVLVWTQ